MTLRGLRAKNVGEVTIDKIGNVLSSRRNDENLRIELVSIPILFAEISSAVIKVRRNDLRCRAGSLANFEKLRPKT
jgi:hypothetical protein